MIKIIPAAKKLAIGVVSVGALSLGTAGIAGAATAPVTVPKVGAHFNCARATKVLTRIQKAENRIAAGLPKLKAAEAKAAKNGRMARAARLEKRINRFESTTLQTRLTKASAAIEAKCHVPAPATTSGSTTQA
jgi:hypothetical protein